MVQMLQNYQQTLNQIMLRKHVSLAEKYTEVNQLVLCINYALPSRLRHPEFHD